MIWEKKTLGDVSKSIQTGPFGSQLHQSDYSETGIPVVMPKDLINGKISEETIARVQQEHVNRLSRHKIDVGDILYSRRGDVGRCAFTTEREKNWLCGTGCQRVTIDKEQAEPQFVFYQLQKAEIVGWVIKHAVGASIGYFGLCGNEVCTNQGFILCIPKNDNSRYWLLYNLMSRVDEIRQKASGSTFLEISKKTFREMAVVLPSDSVLEQYTNVILPLINQMETKTKQGQCLTQARDRLLPKLMSGEIEV